MKHHIVVLGAGYAGSYVAGTLARRLSRANTEITVVNAEPDFVQRLRLHQLAAGRQIEAPQLTDVFAGTGIRLRLARVTAVDPDRQVVAVADADGGGEIGYDTLLYALGSRVTTHGVPGVAEHAFDVACRPSALRLRERLDSLSRRDGGGSVLVVGDGLTGIETATEIAESRPGLSVTLVARGELGAQLSAGARSHTGRFQAHTRETAAPRRHARRPLRARQRCPRHTLRARRPGRGRRDVRRHRRKDRSRARHRRPHPPRPPRRSLAAIRTGHAAHRPVVTNADTGSRAARARRQRARTVRRGSRLRLADPSSARSRAFATVIGMRTSTTEPASS